MGYSMNTDNGIAVATVALAAGQPVVMQLADGAFLLSAAGSITADAINFMARHGRGLIGMPLTPARADQLGLSTLPRRGRRGTFHYTQSIEARNGVATGISAADRAVTIIAAASGTAADIATPGHIFPYLPEGRPDRPADMALTLIALAGQGEAAVTCLILDDAGEVAPPQEVERLARQLGLPLIRPEDVGAVVLVHAG